MTIPTLTEEQRTALRAEAEAAYAAGQSASPMVSSPTFRAVIDGLPVGSRLTREAGVAWARAWDRAASARIAEMLEEA